MKPPLTIRRATCRKGIHTTADEGLCQVSAISTRDRPTSVSFLWHPTTCARPLAYQMAAHAATLLMCRFAVVRVVFFSSFTATPSSTPPRPQVSHAMLGSWMLGCLDAWMLDAWMLDALMPYA
eukprot:scaffold834_cov244-Pinguiococcus_pyrenoidosus.AAC.25